MTYQMLGIIIQPFYENILFEGFDLKHNEKDNSLIGKMNDIFGPSSIKGNLDLNKSRMNFEKKYDSRKDIIKYFFEKTDGNLWAGKFMHASGNFGRESYCEIFKTKENPKFDWDEIRINAQMSVGGSEDWAKGFTQSMIEEGWFETTKDKKTGEILLHPSKNPPYKID